MAPKGVQKSIDKGAATKTSIVQAKVKVDFPGRQVVVLCIHPNCYEPVFTVHASDLQGSRPAWRSLHQCGGCHSSLQVRVNDKGIMCIEKFSGAVAGPSFVSSSDGRGAIAQPAGKGALE
jgi:hypothetical protein